MYSHEDFMKLALHLAKEAAEQGEVPVGAVITLGQRVISIGKNTREESHQACGHAEMNVIRAANRNLQNWRLLGCNLYVTLEPCIMCAGAIQQSRIETVFFGANDPKGGAYGSLYSVHEDTRLNHVPKKTQGGLLADESSKLLKDFFTARRK